MANKNDLVEIKSGKFRGLTGRVTSTNGDSVIVSVTRPGRVIYGMQRHQAVTYPKADVTVVGKVH